MTTFRLAAMSPLFFWMTVFLFGVPVGFAVAVLVGHQILALPTLLVSSIYLWVWLRFRPTHFVVHGDALEIVWPAKRRRIARREITDVRIIDGKALHDLVGWGMRVGAGGLWGGFGWLWTRRRGIVQMYISRTDGFVWIERGGERPWLVTPERPDEFVRALGPR